MKIRETLTELGANRLATDIRDYWARKGKRPKIWIEPVWAKQSNGHHVGEIFCIRSDMVNGEPS